MWEGRGEKELLHLRVDGLLALMTQVLRDPSSTV